MEKLWEKRTTTTKLQRLWVLDASQIPRPTVHGPKPRTRVLKSLLVCCFGVSDIGDASVIAEFALVSQNPEASLLLAFPSSFVIATMGLPFLFLFLASSRCLSTERGAEPIVLCGKDSPPLCGEGAKCP